MTEVLYQILGFITGIACFGSLAGVFNVPIFPVRSHILRGVLGLAMFGLLGQLILNMDHAEHIYRYTGDTVMWMWITFLVLVAWASWVWHVEILGFFYSFSPHPAADIVDQYIETDSGFDATRIKTAFNDMPAEPVFQKVRARQADEMAAKLEQENQLAAANERAQRELVSLRLARARNERLQERLEDDE